MWIRSHEGLVLCCIKTGSSSCSSTHHGVMSTRSMSGLVLRAAHRVHGPRGSRRCECFASVIRTNTASDCFVTGPAETCLRVCVCVKPFIVILSALPVSVTFHNALQSTFSYKDARGNTSVQHVHFLGGLITHVLTRLLSRKNRQQVSTLIVL
jgi:hypothetical protein